MCFKNTLVQGWEGGKAKAYFLVQGWVGGSKMAILGRTYFMDGPDGKCCGSRENILIKLANWLTANR